jgi:succinate dehydrogenase / fumarate reductase flavoprotein subunit/fumarate reductase flavoprotein subunit
LGAEFVEKTFPGMVERCREIGFDLARKPVKVSPTAHFHMGGARIDTSCRTNLPGLFVAGEDSGGVHGANRLGGNGVAESLVFGTVAGDSMAQYVTDQPQPSLDPKQIEAAIAWAVQPVEAVAESAGDGENIFHIRQEIERLMWAKGGLVRDGTGLQEALVELSSLSERAERASVSPCREYNPGWHEWLNVQSLLTVAQMTCQSALVRNESRGSHYRSDYPDRNEIDWLCNILLRTKPDGTPDIWNEKVEFPRLSPKD